MLQNDAMFQRQILEAETDRRTVFVNTSGSLLAANSNGADIVDFDGLSEKLANLHEQDVIVSQLFGTVDAYDIAKLLHEHDYKGTFLAMSPAIPSRTQIVREIQSQFSGFTFDIVITPDL